MDQNTLDGLPNVTLITENLFPRIVCRLNSRSYRYFGARATFSLQTNTTVNHISEREF